MLMNIKITKEMIDKSQLMMLIERLPPGETVAITDRPLEDPSIHPSGFSWSKDFIKTNRGHSRQAQRALARLKAGLAGSKLDERITKC